MNDIKRILLAEDDSRDADLTLTALAECGLADDVFLTRDGEEALDYLRREGRFSHLPAIQPALLLLDLKMPKVDGLEVIQQLKSDEKLRLIPVVVLSSSRELRDVSQCYALGVNAYVVKPLDFSEFLESIRRVAMFWVQTNEPPPGSANKPI